MLLFCPHCSSILRITSVQHPTTGHKANRFSCQTCTYICPIKAGKGFYEVYHNQLKQVDDIMGGSQMWENAPKTEIQCAKEGCDGNMAMYYQLQIRSADEPMTTFYKCVKCLKDWKEG